MSCAHNVPTSIGGCKDGCKEGWKWKEGKMESDKKLICSCYKVESFRQTLRENHMCYNEVNRNCLGQFREISWNPTTDVHRVSTLITPVKT